MSVTESTGPRLRDLRPLKPTTTLNFPVYQDLSETLVVAASHPDPKVAHVLGTCAGYSYSEAHTLTMIMTRIGLVDCRCIKIDQHVDPMFIASTSYLLQSRDGRSLILCYRGTELVSPVSWLTDIDINPETISIDLGDGLGEFEVHGGFYRNVRATRPEVVTALERAVKGQPIVDEGEPVDAPLEALYITGHSLGGAMAALMAIMLVTEPNYKCIAEKLRAVYTFGQPMVGSPALARACDREGALGGKLFRYVYGKDIVAQLPPTAAGSFEHFGAEYEYRRKGSNGWTRSEKPTKQLYNLLELLTVPISFLARQLRITRHMSFRASIYDHLPHLYVASLPPPDKRDEFGD